MDKKQKSAPPVQKGSKITVEIDGLGHSGEGVGRIQGFTIFVPGALPGEEVLARIMQVKSSYAKAALLSVVKASADRIAPRCEIYEACGGCQMQHLSYPAQLKAKQQQVSAAVSRIAKLENVKVLPTLGAANPWDYRNKMQFPVGLENGKRTIGCFASGTHQVIDTKNCYIQHALNNRIAAEVRRLLQQFNVSVYDEQTGQGVIRHVIGRVGTASGEAMVVLVTATDTLPHSAEIVVQLRRNVPELVSIVQNINPKRTNVIMGDRNKLLWGKEYITDKLGDFSFNISPRSFFQVNTEQARVLYDKAVEYAGLTGRETVIDAYCGTGTIAMFMARQAAKVYGIEIVEAAIADAKVNARNNGISNVEFICGDAIDVMPKLAKEGIRADVVVTDPPRAGCAPKVLETFAGMNPDRIVYISCNPASLARDLAVLAEYGYIAREIQPVDMFPQTHHVECVALIERKKP